MKYSIMLIMSISLFSLSIAMEEAQETQAQRQSVLENMLTEYMQTAEEELGRPLTQKEQARAERIFKEGTL